MTIKGGLGAPRPVTARKLGAVEDVEGEDAADPFGELSPRLRNVMHIDNIATVDELAKRGSHELLRTPNFRLRDLNEVRAFLARRGRALADEDEIAASERAKAEKRLAKRADRAATTALWAKLRVARATDRPAEVARFYRDGLGFQELARFENHDGFDGIILGHPGAPYHLEFTHRHGHVVGRASAADILLVFYLPDRQAWSAALDRMTAHGATPVASQNPYWDRDGVTFEDPDGCRIVLRNAAWSP